MPSLPPLPHASSGAGYSVAPNPLIPPSRSGSTFWSPYPTNYTAAFRFKPSPFFMTDQVVFAVLECPVSYVSSRLIRRTQLLNNIQDPSLAMLKSLGSGYQLCLFCTSSKFYFSTATTTIDCPIEFSQTCEIYVNDVLLKMALLKGIKKRPGTAPPPELAPSAHGTPDTDIRRQMVASMSKDDDIIAVSLKMSLKMSLKCPLSFMRITTPCRLCTVCENVIDWRELIIDGFFAEILKPTPDSVDDVPVEADGA
ncbi:hypothetical protein B0H14DRAFT_3477555 [Mycena olivaceomarginata]|nr:hypothetical protein B0H14DRAFT_3477555 [Mycena olivaceomarginata]